MAPWTVLRCSRQRTTSDCVAARSSCRRWSPTRALRALFKKIWDSQCHAGAQTQAERYAAALFRRRRFFERQRQAPRGAWLHEASALVLQEPQETAHDQASGLSVCNDVRECKQELGSVIFTFDAHPIAGTDRMERGTKLPHHHRIPIGSGVLPHDRGIGQRGEGRFSGARPCPFAVHSGLERRRSRVLQRARWYPEGVHREQ